MNTISWSDFEKIDIRTGTIKEVYDFPRSKKAAYRIKIDFGELGFRQSSAQITDLYSKDELIGKQVIAVVNFPVKQVANFFSECLILGVANHEGQVVLLETGKNVPDGMRIF